MTFEAEEVQVRVLGVGIGANLVPNILVLNLLVGNELTPSHVAGQPHHVRAPVIPRTLGAHETSDIPTPSLANCEFVSFSSFVSFPFCVFLIFLLFVHRHLVL